VKSSRAAKASLSLARWSFEGEPPPIPKYVLLLAPHTSNWDTVIFLFLARSVGLELSWMIKDSWTKGPIGPLLDRFGAVGIDRSHARNMVEQMVDEFRRRDRFVLGIPPEGTRARAEHWKSGFYRIALGAGVPVAPGYLDYGRKVGGIGAPIEMTGDVTRDMDGLRAFYAKKSPRPYDASKFGPIRLREEVDPRSG
jgi:1-acyl-sn-glycerol-3-phosphate acyltransferase